LSAAYEPAPVEGSQTASQPVSRNKDRQEPAVCRGGHNDRYADKLLVLIDGRSLYSSAQSGVFWEVQNLMLEDIERIEIIRGPGARCGEQEQSMASSTSSPSVPTIRRVAWYLLAEAELRIRPIVIFCERNRNLTSSGIYAIYAGRCAPWMVGL
jgi:hypothetical protein